MIERRFFTSGISLRMSEGPSPKITGYCARFEPVVSSDLGGFREKIRKGAFYNSLQSDRDVICNVEHDNARILGRKKNGTLALAEDDYGLRFACALPDTTDGRDVAALIKRSDLQEMSFAFQADPDGDEWDEDGEDPDERGKRCTDENAEKCSNFRLQHRCKSRISTHGRTSLRRSDGHGSDGVCASQFISARHAS